MVSLSSLLMKLLSIVGEFESYTWQTNHIRGTYRYEGTGFIDMLTDLPSLVDFDFVLCKHLDFDKSFDLYFQLNYVYF